MKYSPVGHIKVASGQSARTMVKTPKTSTIAVKDISLNEETSEPQSYVMNKQPNANALNMFLMGFPSRIEITK